MIVVRKFYGIRTLWICFFVSLFLLNGCDRSEPKEVGVYAYNMLYACGDCSLYRIFRVDDLNSTEPKLKDRTDQIDIATKDQLIADEMSRAYKEVGSPNEDTGLIGLEVKLKFKDSKEENLFYEKVGISPICHLCYFQGYLDHDVLFVDDYKVMEKMPNCIPSEAEIAAIVSDSL